MKLKSVLGRLRSVLAVLAVCLWLSFTSNASVPVERLRCEYLDNPPGIDTPQPRLSWVLTSGERGQKQSAYQILVASSERRKAASPSPRPTA